MAYIKIGEMVKIEKFRNRVHGEITATYTTFEDNGDKYLQIDTYGTLERAMPEKISQTIQFNRESAKYMIELLKNEFGL